MKNYALYGAVLSAALLARLGHAEQFTWNNAAGGSYGAGANWTGTVSPPGTLPGAGDTVLFNLGSVGGYTVSLSGNVNQAGLKIANDNVTFSLGGAVYGNAAPVPFQAGVGTGNTTFFIVQGNGTIASPQVNIFNTSGAVIGASGGTGSVSLVDAAWVNTGAMDVGQDAFGNTGTGSLAIGASSSLSTGSLILATGGSYTQTAGSFAASTVVDAGMMTQSGGSVNVTGTIIIGSIAPISYSLSGSATLNAMTLNLTGLAGTYMQNGGTAGFTNLNLSGNNSMTVSAGAFTVAHTFNDGTIQHSGGTMSLGLVDGQGNIQASGTAQMTAGSIRQGGLSIGDSAVVSLLPSIGNDSTSTLDSITITGNGKLNLNNTDMAFYSTSADKAADYAALLNLVKTGRDGGAWDGNGITSSAAQSAYAAQSNQELTALAVVRNDQLPVPLTTFAGVPVDNDTILIAYTYVGDANLDGRVSLDDYLILDRGYLDHLSGWQNGDFNDDGVINGADYAAIDRVYAAQGGPLAAGLISEHTAEFGEAYVEALDGSGGINAVPEPASLGLLAVGALGLLARRRGQRRTDGR